MSGVTHSPTRQALLYHDRRAKRIAVAVVTMTAVLLVGLALILGEGGSQTARTQQPAIDAKPAPTSPLVSRYDGGPDEGTRGTASAGASSHAASGTRYDGGPDEGSRGVGR
jgi:hypothetical protein